MVAGTVSTPKMITVHTAVQGWDIATPFPAAQDFLS